MNSYVSDFPPVPLTQPGHCELPPVGEDQGGEREKGEEVGGQGDDEEEKFGWLVTSKMLISLI